MAVLATPCPAVPDLDHMNVPREINADAAKRRATEKHIPIDPQGMKPEKSPFSPMMHGCVLD